VNTITGTTHNFDIPKPFDNNTSYFLKVIDNNENVIIGFMGITPTPTRTKTITPTASITPTISITKSPSLTPTNSITPTITPTNTVTPTITRTNSITPTITPTNTGTPTITRTNSTTPTITPTQTKTPTPTVVTNTFNVTANGFSAYIINGVSNPTLTLTEGQTYTFNINASGHPFWIKTAQTTGTGNQYNTGVTNNGTDNGVITFVVPYGAPSTLYYICQYHGSMVGIINI